MSLPPPSPPLCVKAKMAPCLNPHASTSSTPRKVNDYEHVHFPATVTAGGSLMDTGSYCSADIVFSPLPPPPPPPPSPSPT
ncbi:unnamed protein product, partial [Pleuronectes platessa]